MWKLTTGEPYAGEPHVRFGGRGGESLPYPYQQAFDLLFEISQMMDTGLDKESLSIVVSLCETGVNPEALSALVREFRRENQISQQLPSDDTMTMSNLRKFNIDNNLNKKA